MKQTTKKFELTEGQQNAIDALQVWWNSEEQNIVLSGSPGTGKTFLAKFFVNSLNGCVPLFTAPTNEAVKQLELSLAGAAPTKTTYSALGLKLSMSSFKQRIYQSKLPEDYNDFNLLIVDESSMAGRRDVNNKKAHNLLMDYVINSGMRTIWLGDWAQLPPVESTTGTSPVFDAGFETLELTQVKRHAGAILDFAMDLRNILTQPIRNLPKEIDPEIRQRLPGYDGLIKFTAEEFDAIVADKARIITWTNAATKYSKCPGVKEYNFMIRSMLFGEREASESDVYPTDKILFSSPLFETTDGITFENLMDTEFEMVASVNTKAEVIRTEIVTRLGVECHKADLELEGGINATAYIPTKLGEQQKYEKENEFKKLAAESGESKKAAKAWQYYHTFRQCFADVKHTYCITSHRAQGSTIDQVFVDTRNILQNRDRLVAFKSLYVAATRAKNQLTLIR